MTRVVVMCNEEECNIEQLMTELSRVRNIEFFGMMLKGSAFRAQSGDVYTVKVEKESR